MPYCGRCGRFYYGYSCSYCDDGDVGAEGLLFRFGYDGYEVSGVGRCKDADVTVPSSFEGFDVVGIGEGAFKFCRHIESVRLPDGITDIDREAFYFCSSMVRIVLPKSLRHVRGSAFSVCRGLKYVYFGGTYSDWAKISVEEGNTALVSATKYYYSRTVPDNIGKYWHYGAGGDIKVWDYAEIEGERERKRLLAEETKQKYGFTFEPYGKGYAVTGVSTNGNGKIVIPTLYCGKPVVGIAENAFRGNTDVRALTVPQNVVFIGRNAFLGCCRLTEIRNLSYLTITPGSEDYGFIAYYAAAVFRRYEKCGSFYTTHDGFEFYDDGYSLRLVGYSGEATEIELPRNLERSYTVQGCAFYGNKKLKSVIFADGATEVGASAFEGCSALENVTLPRTLEYVGPRVFEGCDRLDLVYYVGRRSSWAEVRVDPDNDRLHGLVVCCLVF